MILSSSASLPIILLAEDHPDDVFIMRFALKRAGLPNPLFVARDGEEVVEYLGGEGAYADRGSYPFPSLVLLDLKMPRMDGFDVLRWCKSHPEINGLPIVVLSGSDLDEDKQRANELGAADYRVKPVGTENLILLLQELHSRWLPACSVFSAQSLLSAKTTH
jgi:CheY-like chemotaxis protein